MNTKVQRGTVRTKDNEVDYFRFGAGERQMVILPGMGVKISKVANLSNDLALALAASRVRIEAPIPGKAAIGIEVPNRKRTTVYLRDILNSREFTTSESFVTASM